MNKSFKNRQEVSMVKFLMIFLLFCSFKLYAQSDKFFTIDQLKSKSVNDLFSNIEGNYQSSLTQMGWSDSQPLDNYYLKIDSTHTVCLYQKDFEKPDSYLLLYKLEMELTNSNGIIEVKTKTIYTNKEIDFTIFNKDWLQGIFYISTDYNKIMFGNDIEIDGGPSTTWLRTQLDIK